MLPVFSWGWHLHPRSQDTGEGLDMMPCTLDLRSHCFCPVIAWGLGEGEENSRVSSSLGLWLSEVGDNPPPPLKKIVERRSRWR